MRDEGFDNTGALIGLASTRVPQGSVREYFGMAPGVGDQMDADEGFDNTGGVMQVATDSTGGAYGMFPELEPFAGADIFPQMEYSTSVNKVSRKVDKQIYDNLTTQGMARMSPDSKYKPYHCPKGLIE